MKHNFPEFSGTYDNVFAQLWPKDNNTVIAFIRDCPALNCKVGAWYPDQIKTVCPKGYVAMARPTGLTTGKFDVILDFQGPADNVSTGTLPITLTLTKVGDSGVEGSVVQRTQDATATGTFKAIVCPLS